MKDKNSFGFFLGLSLSCILHLGGAAFYFYFNNQSENLNTKKEPIKISLEMFADNQKNRFQQNFDQPKNKKIKSQKTKNVQGEKENFAKKTAQEVVNETNEQNTSSSLLSNDNKYEFYKTIVKKAIEKEAKPYPKRAKNSGLEGVVGVKIKIGEKGDLQLLEIAKSSGYNMLDSHTKKAILRAEAEFPQLPRDMTFEFFVSYSIGTL